MDNLTEDYDLLERKESMVMVTELLFYVIIAIAAIMILPSFVIYPGIYYGRWRSNGPTFELETKDKTKIEGMILEPEDPTTCKTTFIFFHGNAQNMGNRMPFMQSLVKEYNSYLVSIDYRGFGQSYGFPTESGLINDAESIFERVLNDNRLKDTKKIVYGRSLGGAVAVSLTEKYSEQIDGVILENTFTSVKDVAKGFSYLKSVPEFLFDMGLVGNTWNSLERLIKLENKGPPILFVSGSMDRIVNPKLMEKIYDSYKGIKANYTVKDGTHNDTWSKGGDEYYLKLKNFINLV